MYETTYCCIKLELKFVIIFLANDSVGERGRTVKANSRPSLVVNVTKLMNRGDPNKASKKLEEDAKQLFHVHKDGKKKIKAKKVFKLNSILNLK